MATDEATEFGVLGPLAVTRDGEPVALPGGKAAAALAALVLEAPRAVTSARLAEILWAEDPPPSARNALQVHVSAVRRALRAGGVRQEIVQRGDGYALEADVSQVDLHRFAELRRAALRQAVAGDLELAASSLRDALGLWRGEALAGIRNERLAADAERIEEMRLAAYEELLDAELSCDRGLESIDELTRLVAEHPLRERLRGLLMLALYRSGRQADALGTYRDLRRGLSEELGIEPLPEVQELERRILRHDETLSLATPLVLREPGDAPRRRTVTAVACELRSPDVADPEGWERLVAPAVAVARGVLEEHGGVVETVLGSTVLAVYGVRGRRERHTARGARAALACRDALRASNARSVDVRVAIESGVALVGTSPDTSRPALGTAPADAVRLAHSAPVGYVVVGRRARELAPGVLELEDAKRSEGARLIAVVDPPAPSPARTPRFVGRRRELGSLRRLFDAAAATSTPTLATVVGPPGIGKTRLADRLADRVEGRFARGNCPEDGAQRTFWPLFEAFGDLGLLDETAIAAELAGAPDARRAARVVAEMLGLAPAGLGGEERPPALAAVLDAVAHETALALVVDDLHWAEPTLLDLIAEIVDRCAGRVLVLCLSRTDPRDLRPDWPGEVLVLGPLSEQECARVAIHVLGRDAPSAAVAHVVETAAGNPLFAEELAAIVRDGRPRDDADPLVPPTVEALVSERLELLTPLERDALERASVEGQTFHLDGVADLCRDDPERVRETLHALVRRDLLRPTRSQLAGREAYRFRHVLIRDAAYASLPRRVRAELHERWVEWFEGVVGEELVSWESVGGTHLETSCRIRRELTPDADRSALELRAGELLTTAALHAETIEDLQAAATLGGRAVDLLPPGHPARAELVWRTVMIFSALGRIEDALAICGARSAEALTAGKDDEASLVQLAQLLILTFAGVESPSALAAGLRGSGGAIRRVRSDWLVATREASIGWGHYQRCQIERFLDRFTRAYDVAVRSGDRRQQAVCQSWIALGYVRGYTPVAEAIARCEAMIEGSDVTRTLETQVLLALAELHAMQGRRKRARTLLDRSTEIIVDLGLDWVAAKLCRHAATVEVLIGDRDAARARLVAGYEGFAAIGAPAHAATLVARLAGLAADEGQADEALELAGTCRSIALRDDVLAHVEARAAAARANALRGELERAARSAQDAVRRAARTDEPVLRATAFGALAEVKLATGEPREAETALHAALAEHERKGNRVLAAATERRVPTSPRA